MCSTSASASVRTASQSSGGFLLIPDISNIFTLTGSSQLLLLQLLTSSVTDNVLDSELVIKYLFNKRFDWSLLVVLTPWGCRLQTFKCSVCVVFIVGVTMALPRTLTGRLTRTKEDKVSRSLDPTCVQSEHRAQCKQLHTLTGSSCDQLLFQAD